MGLAVLGVLLASRERHEDAQRRAIGRRSVGLALAAATGFGLFYVGLDASAEHGALWASLGARVGSVCVLAPLAAVAGRRLGARASALPKLALIGVLDVGANVLFALASTRGLLSVVAVLGALYPVVTVLLARMILRERVRRVQEVGIICALLGAVLLAGG